MTQDSNRRSFVVQVLSTAASAWVGVSTVGLLPWLSGCASKPSQEPSPPPQPGPTTVVVEPEPAQPAQPAPVSTIATPPEGPADAGYEPEPYPAPAVKYGGPDLPPPTARPMYGGPDVQPPMSTKYGGMMRPKYGGPPPMDGGAY